MGTVNYHLASAVPALNGKRIVFVFPTLELGGAERQALLFARYLLQEQGANVQVWGFQSAGRAAALCEEYGISWRIVSMPWSARRVERWSKLAEFARVLRRARPDVVLPYTMFANVVCGLIWRLAGAHLCVWNQRDEGLLRIGPRVERRASRLTPRYIANSQQGANFLIRDLGVEAVRIQVIHNGVQIPSPQKGRDVWREELGVDGSHFVACMVANLSSLKDHVTLLKAWRLVVNQLEVDGRCAVLLLAGQYGDTYNLLRALARDLNLGRNVRFLGQVVDVSGVLNASDLAVFSSPSEGCPNGVLECMAAGLAIAATDIPGIRQVLPQVGYGFLAPPKDPERLARSVLDLAGNPDLRAELGAANLQQIQEKFCLQRMCEETSSVISQGLQRKPRSVSC